MDEDGEGHNINYRKIKYLMLNFTPSLPPTLPNSILALMPLVCPSWLLCCLLSSADSASCHATTSRLAAPSSVHLLSCCRLLLCSSSSLVHLGLVHPGCLSCDLSSRHPLPSTCNSASHCTTASHRAPLVSFVRLVVPLLSLIPSMPPVCRRLQLLSRH